jgi:hypothetical protein
MKFTIGRLLNYFKTNRPLFLGHKIISHRIWFAGKTPKINSSFEGDGRKMLIRFNTRFEGKMENF